MSEWHYKKKKWWRIERKDQWKIGLWGCLGKKIEKKTGMKESRWEEKKERKREEEKKGK
jgi:hypothetical protein